MKSRQTPYPTDKNLYLLGARDVEAITSVAQEKVHALESQCAVIPNDEYAALQMVLIKLSEENRVPLLNAFVSEQFGELTEAATALTDRLTENGTVLPELDRILEVLVKQESDTGNEDTGGES